MIRNLLEIHSIVESGKSWFRQLFDYEGGLEKMFNLFSTDYEKLLEEMNKELAA
ncbi:MAG: hypothetical protein ACYC49_15260 [Ignavibacteriaceae bacterium]